MTPSNVPFSQKIVEIFQENGTDIVPHGEFLSLPLSSTIERVNRLVEMAGYCAVIPPSELENVVTFSVVPFKHPQSHYCSESFDIFFDSNLTEKSEDHFNRIKEGIRNVAAGLTGKALILGYGEANDIPFLDLVQQFDQVTIVDIHPEIMEKHVAALPQDLKAKVKICCTDLSGIIEAIKRDVEALNPSPSNLNIEKIALQILCKYADVKNFPKFKDKFQFITSSMLTSQIFSGLVETLATSLKKKFPKTTENFSLNSLEDARTNNFTGKVMRYHIEMIGSASAEHGRVYWCDHYFVELTKRINGFLKKGDRMQCLNIYEIISEAKQNYSHVASLGPDWEWETRQPIEGSNRQGARKGQIATIHSLYFAK